MKTECTYTGIGLMFPVGQIGELVEKCATEIEGSVPEVERVHLSVRGDMWNKKLFSLSLEVSSGTEEVVSSLETDNVMNGLLHLKNETLHRFEESKMARSFELINANPKTKEFFREPILRTAL